MIAIWDSVQELILIINALIGTKLVEFTLDFPQFTNSHSNLAT